MGKKKTVTPRIVYNIVVAENKTAIVVFFVVFIYER